VAQAAGGEGLTIVIPAMNEEQRIGATLDNYASYYPRAEILVVINGTTDNTEEVVKTAQRQHRTVRYLVFPGRIGKGGAVIEEFKAARGAMIGFVDADSSTAPAEFGKLVARLEQDGGLVGCIASRRIKGANVPTEKPFLRLMAGYGFNILVRLLFWLPYSDTQCGAKLFKAQQLNGILPALMVKGWAFDIELLYEMRRLGRIAEVPITWYDSSGSKVRLVRTVWQMFTSVMQLRLLHSPLRKLVGG
jgi:glycosyltransferase involved in cell wall biosynthesis